MQVDFCLGAPIEQGVGGKTRRSWVLRAVLSYSRKGYNEAVMRQDPESFLRCLENALRHFGGVPLLFNLDNLKAAVLKADWSDPRIKPKLAEFCRHYHIHVMPCRPQMPQHKGKVERAVSYVRGNALKGRRFKSLAEENAFLSHWEENVADKRIHGTTCKQIAARFEERSPFDGIVQNVSVKPGTSVKVGDRLMGLVDLSTVWLWAEFYEDELPLLITGQKIKTQTSGVEWRSLTARAKSSVA